MRHQHETRDLPSLSLSSFPVVPLARCLADLLCCAQEWTALVAVDAALHQGRVTYEQVGAYLRGSRRVLGRRRLQRTSSRARSPLETLARVQLRGAGLDVVDGVEIGGVGEVDLLVAGWLVVELDGYEYHSDMWAFDHDRSRDRELGAAGVHLHPVHGEQRAFGQDRRRGQADPRRSSGRGKSEDGVSQRMRMSTQRT